MKLQSGYERYFGIASLISLIVHAMAILAFLWLGAGLKPSSPPIVVTLHGQTAEVKPKEAARESALHARRDVTPPQKPTSAAQRTPPPVAQTPARPQTEDQKEAHAPARENGQTEKVAPPAAPSMTAVHAKEAKADEPRPVQAPLRESRTEVSLGEEREEAAASREAARKTDARNAYLAVLKSRIERYKDYPLTARKGRHEGTVTVKFVLSRDGSLVTVHVARTSGFPILDATALRAVQNAARFPPVPDILKGSDITFEVPITFTLKER